MAPERLAGVFCLLRVARISASMAACRVAGSSRMWRMMALMEGSSSGRKQAAGRSSTSFGPLPASTCMWDKSVTHKPEKPPLQHMVECASSSTICGAAAESRRVSLPVMLQFEPCLESLAASA